MSRIASRIAALIDKNAQLVLSSRRNAILCACFFAIAPYCTWLSVVLIALVTLRQGYRSGAMLLVPAMVAHFLVLLKYMPIGVSLVNNIVEYLPCYIAAITLRLTTSWRAVFGAVLLQIFIAIGLIKTIIPSFVMLHYRHIKSIASNFEGVGNSTDLFGKINLNEGLMAHYVLGMQFVSITIATLIPLLIARSIQSRLFYPDAFKQERLMFRADRLDSMILLALFILAIQQVFLAIDVLPFGMFYFLLAGLSLISNEWDRKKWPAVGLVLLFPLILVPLVVIPVYVALGILDSLFNLRLYFSKSR